MFKIQVFVMLLGSLLVALGLTISVGAALHGALQAQPTISPLDQIDDIASPDEGFVPLMAPTAKTDGLAPEDHPEQQVTAQPVTGQAPETSIPVLTDPSSPGLIPDRIVIPAIQLDAPIIPAKLRSIVYQGKGYSQLVAPNSFKAGWDTASAPLGVSNNTVLFGHHNVYGEVFRYLVNLEVGDLIVIYSGDKRFTYIIALKMILHERNESVDVRLENARWILPSQDERLTLLTCWPYTSNTHRLVIVAKPINVDDLLSYPITMRR